MNKYLLQIMLASSFLIGITSCGPKWTETESNGIKTVTNEGGKTLGYSATSGLTIITANRLAFKDLNKNGQLDKYEDWRLSNEERAKDLLSKMSVEEKVGFMLISTVRMKNDRSSGPQAAAGNTPQQASSSDLNEEDVVRHKLVKAIIRAYDKDKVNDPTNERR